MAASLVQSKHLERGDCTGRYLGALLVAQLSPSSHSLSPSLLPLYLSTSMPSSCAVVGRTSLRARDCQGCCFWIQPAGRPGSVRCSISWDWLSRESASLARLVLPAYCGLASLRALENHRQRQASPGLFDMYIHEHKKQSTSPSLCKLSGIWFSFRALCAS